MENLYLSEAGEKVLNCIIDTTSQFSRKNPKKIIQQSADIYFVCILYQRFFEKALHENGISHENITNLRSAAEKKADKYI